MSKPKKDSTVLDCELDIYSYRRMTVQLYHDAGRTDKWVAIINRVRVLEYFDSKELAKEVAESSIDDILEITNKEN